MLVVMEAVWGLVQNHMHKKMRGVWYSDIYIYGSVPPTPSPPILVVQFCTDARTASPTT